MVDNTDDIKALFERIRSYFEGKDEASMQLFYMLVDETLKLRDELVEKGEESLTVEETREALNKFMNVLKTKEFPKEIGEREKLLVTRWLESLKNLKN